MTPFEMVAALLPLELREKVLSLPAQEQNCAEELRLRVGTPVQMVMQGREDCFLQTRAIQMEDLYSVLEQASHHSVHTVLERMCSGFITVRGGHRIGLCGLAITEDGKSKGFRQLSSLNLRIAKEIKGGAERIISELVEDGMLLNTLIVAPPGAGKTTLLRDLIRCVSEGCSLSSRRVGVVDERGELGALWQGMTQMDLGKRTDVLEGLPKADALLMLLRGMNPQVIAVDEITEPADTKTILQAAGCGVTLLATAHGTDVEEMKLRPVYRELFQWNIFRRAVMIQIMENGKRKIRVEEIPWFGL